MYTVNLELEAIARNVLFTKGLICARLFMWAVINGESGSPCWHHLHYVAEDGLDLTVPVLGLPEFTIT